MAKHPMISSLQNPLVKQVVRLQQKASERRKTGLFVVEGRREVSLAMSYGIEVDHLLISEEIYREDQLYPIDVNENQNLTYVSRAVYNKLAYRKDAEGVIMVGVQKPLSLGEQKLQANSLILVLEGVEKPGNLGAILRTADAAGVDLVILADAVTDVYSPNAIRASLGCVFTVPVVSCNGADSIRWLKDPDKHAGTSPPRIFAAALQTETIYHVCDMNGPVALVFGAEDKGLSEAWLTAAHQVIKIPMWGAIDSLNVAASVAVMCFEVRRQRKKWVRKPPSQKEYRLSV